MDPSLLKSRVTVERLDSIMDWVEKRPAGTLELIFALAQLAAVVAYVWARAKLVEQEWAIAKMEHARKQRSDMRSEIDREDQDGR